MSIKVVGLATVISAVATILIAWWLHPLRATEVTVVFLFFEAVVVGVGLLINAVKDYVYGKDYKGTNRSSDS